MTTHTTSDVWLLDSCTCTTPLPCAARPRLLILLDQRTDKLIAADFVDDLADLQEFLSKAFVAQDGALPSAIIADFHLIRYAGPYREVGLLFPPDHLPHHFRQTDRWLSRLIQAVRARVGGHARQYSLLAYNEILQEALTAAPDLRAVAAVPVAGSRPTVPAVPGGDL
jgi:hypothetical protein